MKQDHNTAERVLAKAVCWEVVSNVPFFFLAWALFGNPWGCAVFTGVSLVVKLGMFYEHERVWSRISWGKRKH